jgi:hypothetical protein
MNAESWKKLFIRTAGFGAGTIVALIVCTSTFYWWSHRPKPWTDSVISAKYTQITLEQEGEELCLVFEYALTNHTKNPYTLPSAYSGALMRRIPIENSLDKLDDSSWDDTLIIPPGQRFNMKFKVVYKLNEYGTTSEKLNTYAPNEDHKAVAPDSLNDFTNRRLSEIDGFVFYDYTSHYRIELPRNWNLKPSKP